MPRSSVRKRPIPLGPAPSEVLAALAHLPGLVFFDSARESGEEPRFSYLAASPAEVLTGSTAGDWTLLEETLVRLQQPDGPDCGSPSGFAAGYVTYEGEFCFGIYPDILAYEHSGQQWSGTGELHTCLLTPEAVPPIRPEFHTGVSEAEFCALVRRAQEYIAAGDIYQANIAHPFEANWSGGAIPFYQALRHYSPSPYGAYLDLGGRRILSSSPELFLKMSGRRIRTRPIKGTRPRRADQQADEQSAFELITSPKEVAELVMITDLERNDLGMVCQYGTVQVTELLRLERHPHVFHLVSTVEGELRPEISQVECLRRCFPGGSITGAPKKRAREIIAELEGSLRGVYTGAIGYFGFNGESQFNIAIRTVVIEGERASFHVGAGIVADSIPEREYQETLDKAAGILLAAERIGSEAD